MARCRPPAIPTDLARGRSEADAHSHLDERWEYIGVQIINEEYGMECKSPAHPAHSRTTVLGNYR